MITIDDVLTYDKLKLRLAQREAELNDAKLMLLEAQMEILRLRNAQQYPAAANAFGGAA